MPPPVAHSSAGLADADRADAQRGAVAMDMLSAPMCLAVLTPRWPRRDLENRAAPPAFPRWRGCANRGVRFFSLNWTRAFGSQHQIHVPHPQLRHLLDAHEQRLL